MTDKPRINIAEYATDIDAEDQGAWQTLECGVRMKLARMGNREYSRRLIAYLEATRDKPADNSEGAVAELYADTLIKDWDEFDWDTEPFPYSPENARRLMTDKSLRHIHRDILAKASSAQAYRLATIEAGAKN